MSSTSDPPDPPGSSVRPSPHDAFFRDVLGRPANAASHLRSVLPAELVKRLDLDHLTLLPGSYINSGTLRARHSDLLFSTRLDGRDALIYMLVEHQSRSHPMMAFRMLQYAVAIWDRHLRDHPTATRLPAILPIVVHHNRRRWKAPTELLDLIDLDPATAEAARDYLPRFRFLLDDLATLDPQALRDRPLTPPALITFVLLMTARGNRTVGTTLRPWGDDLTAVLTEPGGEDDFAAILAYIHLVSETPAEDLLHFFEQLGPRAKEAYMTTAEMLRAQGRAEGEARGRAEGEAHGRAEGEAHGRVEGRAEALLQLLTVKFGHQARATIDAVHAATPAQLETWTARILTATTVDDVLG